jgi:hypothetical protein
MPFTMTTTKTASLDSVAFVGRNTDSGDSLESAAPSVPAAKIGSLTTRTDNDTGTVTMNSGHGFITGNKIDLFWDGGSRRAMDATVTVNSVVLDGGAGDVLPAAASAVTAMKPTEVLMDLDGDEAVALAVKAPRGGFVVFVDDGAADIANATYTIASGSDAGDSWSADSGETNPLATKTVTKVKFSHGYSGAAVDMQASVVLN